MMKLAALSAILLAALASVCSAESRWWQTAVFYQIYPRSFQDSDGDGVGDLQGIISRLEHVKDAGVTAAWLSPIYKSPQVDAGYDISDYKDIHEEYGTLKDFDELIVKANELGIKIVMDFVPNHSSDQHEWFKLSENRTEGYEDYYVWRDGANGDDQTPPNNWISIFRYSAWKYSPIRKQWFLHQFAPEQPDLNYRNPKIIEEMKDIMKFWMDKGVYGFRVDAVPHIAEDEQLRDEPVINENLPDYEYDRLEHIYTKDQQGAYDAIYTLRDFLEEYNAQHSDEDERIMMTEAYTNITNTMRWYGDGSRRGAHFTFNFELIPVNAESNAHDIVGRINHWLQYLPENCTSNWVIGNHDNRRIASRTDRRNADGFNMLIQMLPGVGVTYNGEEIGMEDGEVTWEQGQDPSACNGSPENFDKLSRDFERTPFQWDDTKNAGFSDADETWLPVSSKYKQTNLKDQQNKENSHFRIYQQLTGLRKESEVVTAGQMEIWSPNENVTVVRRYLNNDNYILMFNLGDDEQNLNLQELIPSISSQVSVVISSEKSKLGQQINSEEITLNGHESTIYSN